MAATFVKDQVGFAGVSIQTSFVPGLANAASKDSARVWCERCGCGCTYVDGYKSMYVYGVSHAYGSTDCDSNKQLNVFRV